MVRAAVSVHRGVVSAVGPSGLFVRVAEFGPSALPASLVGPLPSVGAPVVVLDAGEQGSPDLVVVTDLALGGTVASFLQVQTTSGSASLYVRAPAGAASWIRLRAGSLDRWFVGRTSTAESGGNAGSDLQITRCADDGSSIGEVLRISRASGRVTLGRQTVTADSAETVVTKGFVDAVKAALAASSDFADFKTRVAAL